MTDDSGSTGPGPTDPTEPTDSSRRPTDSSRRPTDSSRLPTDPRTAARLLRRRLESGSLELPVTGRSMGSTIRSGSKVRIERAEGPRRGEVWAFVGAGTGIVVHRVRHLTAESMVGRGDGNPLDDVRVPLEHLIGRVTSATDPGGAIRRFGAIDRRTAAIRLEMRGRARALVDRMTGRPTGDRRRRADPDR